MSLKNEKIIDEIRNFFKKNGFSKAVIGLSGGVDSALVSKLSVLALGKENVTAILMPNKGISSDESVLDAENFSKSLEITYHIVPIKNFLDLYNHLDWKASKEAKINIQARIRMTILYHYANSHKALVLGTGNKTEIQLGYFTKYGDGATDILPIANLYKTEVWEMAKELNLPKEIVEKTPSAELETGQSDEGEIGMNYSEIDRILMKIENGNDLQTDDEQKIYSRIMANRHKNQMPYGIK